MNTGFDATNAETMRHAMVASQLRTNAVNDQRVIAAMMSVPREAFVPAESRDLAYRDTALAAGNGRAINLPMVTGRLLTEAYLRASDRVLLIGAAGGYTAALLAQIVAHVVAVEEDAALVALARAALAGNPKVEIVKGPLAAGHAAGAPYDVLVIEGAVEEMPDALVAQVASGGRVVTGLVDGGVVRLATGRKTDGGFGLKAVLDSDCVILPGFAKPRGFTF
ncbi:MULTISPECIES: protein-L-isoaspartate O-methyltransferase [unclassified Sphingomonas]|jgi:protein-L-isoaspartate(D-aspartate) O-methyltransferase|uniref:protein-L-isoaspartate O-methyltransferase family protein n=1 Tax=unclassified Sphingomonas TaxID=196159 RepID=UPI000E107A7A|nr:MULTISPECIES: protein-L-isoaspartate O-methyltransferase [unclassified Sphingomonas]AXJ96219.1 protein-L-isoaspartate O-methyltransferase [Sphingomonas sp. FARSPH]